MDTQVLPAEVYRNKDWKTKQARQRLLTILKIKKVAFVSLDSSLDRTVHKRFEKGISSEGSMGLV